MQARGIVVGSALLFWWPAVGADPSPWRMAHPVRAIYTFLQMPQNTFLAVLILNTSVVTVTFLRWERVAPHPLLPLTFFADRRFSAGSSFSAKTVVVSNSLGNSSRRFR